VLHLKFNGRRRLATIAGPLDMVAGFDRLAGFRHASGDRPAVVELGDFTRASGLAAMERLLAVEPDLDAVFVASDLMADGALTALARAGRRVPEHVAVVGFDDVEVAAATDPPLTTVRQPIVEIGRNLAAALLRQEAGEQVAPSLVLPTELVVRRSA
jgi:DNA-binding LacI/PurR family transcriptional regulator